MYTCIEARVMIALKIRLEYCIQINTVKRGDELCYMLISCKGIYFEDILDWGYFEDMNFPLRTIYLEIMYMDELYQMIIFALKHYDNWKDRTHLRKVDLAPSKNISSLSYTKSMGLSLSPPQLLLLSSLTPPSLSSHFFLTSYQSGRIGHQRCLLSISSVGLDGRQGYCPKLQSVIEM